MPKVASRKGGVREETLASRLAEGPLPLPFTLRCATDVAAALRELHAVGRTHGEVSTASVVLRPSGAALLPANGLPRKVDLRADVAAFGAVLYEMLTGGKPPLGGPLAAPEEHVPHTGVPGLRAAATRLAAKCLAATPDQGPTIQMVATEVRLLNVLTRQSEAETPAPPRAAAFQTGRPPNPLAEWTPAAGKPERAAPIGKPERAGPAESFVGGEPTREFVSAMMSTKTAPSPAPREHSAESPEKQPEGGPADEDELDDGGPTALDRCPKCGSSQVHKSHARTRLEHFATSFGIPICRCHRCFHRYAVVLRFAISRSVPPK
jgi:hypothetical protein